MMSRVNQSNTRAALFSRRWGSPEIVGFCVLGVDVRRAATFGYWIPSSPMPRPALEQPHHRQPTATDQAVLGERVYRVLATAGTEPARGHPHRRHGVAVQLDDEDRAAGNGRAVLSCLS